MKNFFDNLFSAIKHYLIHAFGLTLSLSAIYHTMIQFSDNPLYQKFFGIGGIFAGLSIQYLWGLSAAYRERYRQNGQKSDRGKANRLWCIVILCICIFDFTSSFGVIITEIDKSDQQYSTLDDTRQDIENQIKKLEAEIKEKQEQQKIEFRDNKGRGPNYDKFQTEIDMSKAEIGKLKVELSQVKTEVKTVDRSTFARLGEKAGINPFWIELTMSLGLMFLIYYIPLLTPWKVMLPGNGVTPVTVTSHIPSVTVTDETVKHVTKKPATRNSNKVTAQHVTNVTGDLCVCGCGRPRTGKGLYFSGACRTRLSRRNKREAVGA